MELEAVGSQTPDADADDENRVWTGREVEYLYILMTTIATFGGIYNEIP